MNLDQIICIMSVRSGIPVSHGSLCDWMRRTRWIHVPILDTEMVLFSIFRCAWHVRIKAPILFSILQYIYCIYNTKYMCAYKPRWQRVNSGRRAKMISEMLRWADLWVQIKFQLFFGSYSRQCDQNMYLVNDEAIRVTFTMVSRANQHLTAQIFTCRWWMLTHFNNGSP